MSKSEVEGGGQTEAVVVQNGVNATSVEKTGCAEHFEKE